MESSAPKSIVLLSDGTGNGAAKLFRTNVWRLYQALDLEEPTGQQLAGGARRQVAFYDSGVGTSTFRPLALLGGVFGIGLKRNVLDLYTFLCRNYQPGDRIYAFGFSRGAFTTRVLVGLVAQEGLVTASSERELQRSARDAYRSFRRCFDQTWGLVRPLRNARDAIIRALRRRQGQRSYSRAGNIRFNETDQRIDFVGVWDTVAAYGLPIAEMTRGIDEWVWPLSMPDYVLSKKVAQARHALALDDERDTFHPLLWDETAEPNAADGHERIHQVWFAGMHSDVGGGYPDDALAHVSLAWMMNQAGLAGLRFRRRAVADVLGKQNALAPMHDSRRGLAGYYRYQPRKISARIKHPDPTTLLMRDPDPRKPPPLRTVKIHESVIRRITSGTDRYSPIVLPRNFSVVHSGRTTVSQAGAVRHDPDTIVSSPETEDAAPVRVDRQEAVWNDVWRRRVTYFATVGASLLLVSLPFLQTHWPLTAWSGPHPLISRVSAVVGGVLPGIAQPWLTAFAQMPAIFLVVAGVILWLVKRSGTLQTRIHDDMRDAWVQSLLPAASRSTAGRREGTHWIYRLRSNTIYQRGFQLLKWTIAPGAFGLLVLGLGSLLLMSSLWYLASDRTRFLVAESRTMSEHSEKAGASYHRGSEGH